MVDPEAPKALNAEKPHVDSSGDLILVGTPIGNLSDMSPRAREVIGNGTVVMAEDTEGQPDSFQKDASFSAITIITPPVGSLRYWSS